MAFQGGFLRTTLPGVIFVNLISRDCEKNYYIEEEVVFVVE